MVSLYLKYQCYFVILCVMFFHSCYQQSDIKNIENNDNTNHVTCDTLRRYDSTLVFICVEIKINGGRKFEDTKYKRYSIYLEDSIFLLKEEKGSNTYEYLKYPKQNFTNKVVYTDYYLDKVQASTILRNFDSSVIQLLPIKSIRFFESAVNDTFYISESFSINVNRYEDVEIENSPIERSQIQKIAQLQKEKLALLSDSLHKEGYRVTNFLSFDRNYKLISTIKLDFLSKHYTIVPNSYYSCLGTKTLTLHNK